MKTKLKYIIDSITLISFIVTAISGLVLKFIPGGVRQTGQQIFFGINRRNWAEIHDWAGMLMIIFALIHVIMYWKMFTRMTKNFFKKNEEQCEIKTEVEKK